MEDPKRLPFHFYLGLVLVFVAWYLNWHLDGLRTHILFFPLWLGYILFVDGIVYKRKGESLLSKNWIKFVGLFFISIPVWWLFEGLNLRTQNWIYLGREHFSDLEYFISTRIIIFIGIATLILLLIWPKYFYIFLWLSVFLILDSINHLRGRRSLVSFTNIRDWRPLISLALGCLLCGFFWEMWNYLAYPKWIYQTPGVEFLYIFEMPLLGYLGYIPFSFELFAFYHMLEEGLTRNGASDYILSEY
jgi:hypothetical protein